MIKNPKELFKKNFVHILELVFIGYVILTLLLEFRILINQKPKSTMIYPKFQEIWDLNFSDVMVYSINPQGMVVGDNGNIVITDPENKNVISIDLKNKKKIDLKPINFTEQIFFTSPWGVISSDFDIDKMIWILDSGNGWLYRINSQNHIEPILNIANFQIYNPKGIAVNRHGNLYVSDTGNSRILKFDMEGNLLSSWGKYGEREKEFKEPKTIIIIDDILYILDSINQRISKFDLNGNFIENWGIKTESNWIAKDSDNRIYVISSNSNMIQVFHKDGSLLSKFESTAIAKDFDTISLLSFNTLGEVAVCNKNQIALFNITWSD